MSPTRKAILDLVTASPAGIGSTGIRARLGLTANALKAHLKFLRRSRFVVPTNVGCGALWVSPCNLPEAQEDTDHDDDPPDQRLVAADQAEPLRPLGPRSVWDIA